MLIDDVQGTITEGGTTICDANLGIQLVCDLCVEPQIQVQTLENMRLVS